MRYPAVAGAFYSAGKEGLEKEIKECFSKGVGLPKLGNKRSLLAVVSPHAGYVYSGWVSAFSYSKIAENYKEPPTFVIVGPNHTGIGSGVSISKEDWQTPLGVVKNDDVLGEAIQENSKFIDFDEVAHRDEHSIEVQLPFLQFIYKEFKFVPITMMMQDLETAEDVAKAVFNASNKTKKEVVLIASSDFTHYEPAETAKEKDMVAIEAIEKLDARLFSNEVEMNRMSICGFAPIMSAVFYSKLKGAKSAKLVKYANSGDVSRDYSSVVAYASIEFPK
jgi:hypothetical protein